MSNAESEKTTEKRSKKLFIAVFCSILATFLLPILTVMTVTLFLPPVYNETFVGELYEKYERLNSIEEPKIVVIGGSSVAFGLDSPMIEEHLNMPVVNFGLYANLGTKIMLDLSRSAIEKGDIVVIAPEMNADTLSLYFNQETALQALDGNFEMLSDIDSENYESLIGASYSFAGEKLSYLISGKVPENMGAYKKEWFNEQGDNTFDRPYNTMSTVQKTIDLSFRYDSTDEKTTEYEEFIDYLNEYVDYCKNHGASVYFSFCPMNSASITDSTTEENILDFYVNLTESLHCKIISDINDYIMDEGYFFDSEFHLNNSGVTVRTVRLIDDIKREFADTTITMKAEELPTPAGYAPFDFEGEDEVNIYFELEFHKTGADQYVYRVVGLTEEGRSQITLKIPSMVNGTPVDAVLEGAFQGAEVRTLILSTNVRSLVSKALSGANMLTAVYIPHEDPNLISVPNNANQDGLATEGANPEIKLFVPESAFESYKADYFWGDYSGKLVPYEKNAEE